MARPPPPHYLSGAVGPAPLRLSTAPTGIRVTPVPHDGDPNTSSAVHNCTDPALSASQKPAGRGSRPSDIHLGSDTPASPHVGSLQCPFLHHPHFLFFSLLTRLRQRAAVALVLSSVPTSSPSRIHPIQHIKSWGWGLALPTSPKKAGASITLGGHGPAGRPPANRWFQLDSSLTPFDKTVCIPRH